MLALTHLTLLILCLSTSAFLSRTTKTHRRHSPHLAASEKKSTGLEGLFQLSEVLGKLASFGKTLPRASESGGSSRSRASVREVAGMIRNEYDNIFWATGNMDLSLWQDNCSFADPFSSFGGAGSSKRFKQNADNLGRFVENPSLRVTKFETTGLIVSVGWVFKGTLRLPWRPVLAAAGETFHTLNPNTLLIEAYKETWKSDVWEVLKRLLVPGKGK